MRALTSTVVIGSWWLVMLSSGLKDDVGVFWQISDIHFDSNYSSYPPETGHVCHMKQGWKNLSGRAGNGTFGDFNCDSPWLLVQSAFNAMKTINISQQPDFIIWTGDNSPHVPNSDIDLGYVAGVVGNVTQTMRGSFPPSVPIYPTLGNHDTWPDNQYPAGPNSIYSHMLKRGTWEQLLDAEQQKTFRTGGYYVVQASKGLRIISSNSNLWYKPNTQVANMSGEDDPSGQFEWLEQVLTQARDDKQKTIIIGHEPPGYTARQPYQGYYPSRNKRFVSLLQRYKDVITSCIYGHTHSDSFKIISDAQGVPISVIYVAPSVTPIGNRNPSVRLYTYNRRTGAVLDYSQYYLNLTRANLNPAEGARWQTEYHLLNEYNLDDARPESLKHLLQTMEIDDATFDKYYNYNAVSASTDVCRGDCKQQFLCALSHVDYTKYEECMDGKTDFIIITVCAVFVVLLIFVVTVIVLLRRKSRKTLNRYSEADYALVQEDEDFA